jgi:hypothetical protein
LPAPGCFCYNNQEQVGLLILRGIGDLARRQPLIMDDTAGATTASRHLQFYLQQLVSRASCGRLVKSAYVALAPFGQPSFGRVLERAFFTAESHLGALIFTASGRGPGGCLVFTLESGSLHMRRCPCRRERPSSPLL